MIFKEILAGYIADFAECLDRIGKIGYNEIEVMRMYRNERAMKYPQSIQLFAARNYFDMENSNTNPIHAIVKDRAVCYFTHMHETLEVVLCEESQLHCIIDGQTVIAKPGDVLVISPFEKHEISFFTSDGSVRFGLLLLEVRFFMPTSECILRRQLEAVLAGKKRLERLFPAESRKAEALRSVFASLHHAYRNRDTLSGCCSQMSGAYAMLELLLDETGSMEARSPRLHTEFVESVSRYIEEKYPLELSTSTVARAMGYNLTSFCHLFKQSFGMSFLAYLQDYRIHKAITEYRDSDLPVAEIAAAVGFSDVGWFWRVFRRQMGTSPREYFRGK